MTVRTIGVAMLPATMFVSSTFVATDTLAANPLVAAKPVGVQQAQPEPDVVLLVVSAPNLAGGIALIDNRDRD